MKKKYKLILKYPGCQYQLNQIINTEFIWIDGIKVYLKDYPEFWEEVVEKDYEILVLKCNTNYQLLFKDDTVYYKNNEFQGISKGNVKISFSLSQYEKNINNNSHWSIHSVKRKSDGEVFTVGDRYRVTNPIKENRTIASFRISNNTLLIHPMEFGYSMLSEIYPIEKPLFTTEDGVDIYKGDIAVPIDPKTFRIFASTTYNTGESIRFGNYLYFSTREAAEEYILMNKPCLSLNDLLNTNYWGKSGNIMTKLKQLVKSKL